MRAEGRVDQHVIFADEAEASASGESPFGDGCRVDTGFELEVCVSEGSYEVSEFAQLPFYEEVIIFILCVVCYAGGWLACMRGGLLVFWGCVVQAEANYGPRILQEFGGVGSLIEVFAHVEHSARVAKGEPVVQEFELLVIQGRSICYADEVETEFDGFLLYVSS